MNKWTTDIYAEEKLKEYGIGWQVQSIAIKDIDWKASEANKARGSKPINVELVEDYSLAMQSGDAFPMIVVEKTKAGYYILSGNHRSRAAKDIGRTTIDAYVVKGNDPAAIDILPRIFNRGHGSRQDRSEAIRNAIWVINKHKLTASRAAELFGLSKSYIQNELRADAVGIKLEAAGIDPACLVKDCKLRLGTIATDAVMVSVARVIAGAKLTGTQAGQLIDDIKAEKRSEASQMAIVSRWQDKLANAPKDEPKPALFRGRSIRTDFLIGIRTIERVIKGIKHLEQLQITDEKEQREIAARLSEISKRLHKLSHA
jgi:ParB-like chromosome segregation protein Spo0J